MFRMSSVCLVYVQFTSCVQGMLFMNLFLFSPCRAIFSNKESPVKNVIYLPFLSYGCRFSSPGNSIQSEPQSHWWHSITTWWFTISVMGGYNLCPLVLLRFIEILTGSWWEVTAGTEVGYNEQKSSLHKLAIHKPHLFL